MDLLSEKHQAWLDLLVEDVVDPSRPIVDSHHHLWDDFGLGVYMIEDFWRDAGGHNIEKSVYVECTYGYYEDGPDYLKPVGETAFAAAQAEKSRKGNADQSIIAGIIATTDLRLPNAQLDEVLAAHLEAGNGLFRGIRQALVYVPEGAVLMAPENVRAPKGMHADSSFQNGVALLGRKGHSYESWHYHTQLQDFLTLAQAVPDTVMILNHLGHPIGVDRWADKRDEVYAQWKNDMAAIARCENVYLKLGGMAMPDNGWGWHLAERPPTSGEFANAQSPWYRHAVECFGPERCMLESNFPMDRMSLSYQVYWNGVKKIFANFSEYEKTALFSGTATKAYRLD